MSYWKNYSSLVIIAFIVACGADACAQSLTLLYPNGGETLDAGSTVALSWKTTGGTISRVTLEHSADNGATWMSIVRSVTNTGSYSWTVPVASSSKCLVRVSNAENGADNVEMHRATEIKPGTGDRIVGRWDALRHQTRNG